jgi:hypothetical protein
LALGSRRLAIASDAASAAGANPVITTFDELWGYTSERSRRLWDEMVPPPTRKIACRLTVSYAGFSNESVLLEELHNRGMALPEVAPSLRAGDGMLMAWHTEPIAPWQTESWLAEMRRSLRPNAYLRMMANQFVSTESTFIDMAWWDACVGPAATPLVISVRCRSPSASTPRSSAILGVKFRGPTRPKRLSPDGSPASGLDSKLFGTHSP